MFLQVVGYAPPFNMCGKFEVCDAEGDVQFAIQVPCLLTTCCCTQVKIVTTNVSTYKVLSRLTLSSAA